MRISLQAPWSTISPLLDELLDLDAAQRELRLAEVARGGEAGARLAGELRQLLDASVRAQQARFLAGEGAAALVPAPSLVGSRLGGFVIEAALGGGANGSVWRARPVAALDGAGAVALKLLHLSLLGQPAALRFRREAALLASMKHAGIASLAGTGTTPEGQPYLLLELVDGAPIDEYCDRERLDVRARLELFAQLLAAVAYAHERGVVHRDLKPSNILVTASGCVKLLDFGIARLCAGEGGSTLTGTGARALTPQYGAPEQFRGDTPSPATDVFALGLLLFKLLTGEHAFAVRAGASGNVFPRPAPSLRKTLRRIADRGRRAPLMEVALERIVATALQREPQKRYRDASEFAAQVALLLLPRDPDRDVRTPWQRLRTWFRRPPR